ncbi:IucA/IucC family protein [Azospirillum sp. BE72]|uniref:IucA/IucC family protein n=1 Tax=Azospirillum sp. BE72 TaxID=2817776 RepID=UPI002867A8B1|nr:IucA/IucC family protein [Azospirillum sp. BE72]MDR6772780.1 siderophore synthetase component [Azospirillum sp. BE72]
MPFPRDLPGRPEERPAERVVRQLAAALLFEGIVEPAADGVDGDDRRLVWRSGGREFRCLASAGPFGRPRIRSGSVEMRGDDGMWRAATLGRMVAGLDAPEPHLAGLLAELERTVSLCRWNAANLPATPRRGLPFPDLEGRLEEGHPYHPCFKARLGFDEADHAAFGPEVGQRFQLVWLLVARSCLHRAIPGEEEEFWQSELGPAAWAEVQRRREELNLPATDYCLLPLHPWQWWDLREGEGAPWLRPWLADGRAVCLGPLGDHYRASQSVRTVMNADDPRKADVKLALNIVNTASRRIIAPHSVCTGPAISEWLGAVVAGDADFRDRYPLTLLPEYAGIIADRHGPLAGQMAALWRRSVQSTLGEGESAIPFNMLMVTEADGSAFAAPWIERYGLLPWLDRMLEVAVLPVWHLLVRHGIAVEAHGQNMVLVHRDGWPVRLILRDFHDSVEYAPDFVADPALLPDFPNLHPAYRDAPPDRYYWAGGVDALRELAMDTLFVFNLTDVSDLLALKHGLPEPEFWRRVHDLLEAHARRHGLEERHRRVGHAAPEILTESLLRGKLLRAREEIHHTVPNIFARFAPEGSR